MTSKTTTEQGKAMRELTEKELNEVTGGFQRPAVYDPFAPIHGRDVPGGAPYCGTVVGYGRSVPRPLIG